MSLIALPTTSSNRRWLVWLMVPAGLVLVIALIWSLGGPASPSSPGAAGMFHRAVLTDMDVRIVKDGELQAINAIEIQSDVEGQTTIQTLVKEGASIRKGDVLIVLDSSQIRQKIEDTFLELQKAEADLTNARELREIQISKNNADLEAAEVALQLAEIGLRQYIEGTYEQQLANHTTDLEMAEINLKNAMEKLAQTKALHSKGFVTVTQVKDDELAVLNATNNVQKAKTALNVLTEYTHQMTLAEKQNTLSQAEQRLARVKRENAASLSQRDADVRAKEQGLLVMKRRMERLEQQLTACTIHAPADGMVVYATSNDRNAQNSLQEGMQVRERQSLLRLPDTSSMKVVVRINESQVARLREGQRASITLPNLKEPIGATLTKISVLADSSQRWWNPDLKEYPVDLVLDHTPPSLKPGMGAMASIYVTRLNQVLAVPPTTIYSVGQQNFVFVRNGANTPRAVKVRIGATNETSAQILEGLEPGDEVKILQVGEGQSLLERNGIKLDPTPTTQPSAMDRENRTGNGENGVGMPAFRSQSDATPGVNGPPAETPAGERAPRGDGPRRRPRPDSQVPAQPQ